VKEFTPKAVIAGVLLGILFGAANAYVGLRVGMTVSASIPAAVMTVAAFRLMRRPGTILEANLSQTIGSASTSLATGTIFTIPALFLWGMTPPYLQVVALCFLGGVLGIAAMIPLRRLLIVRSHGELPYPEGTACAEVLRATAATSGEGAWIFRGMAVGAGVKLAVGLLFVVPGVLSVALPMPPKAVLALELTPALIGVGFILGYRASGVIVAGSLLSSLALIPLIAWIGGHLDTPLPPETTALIRDLDADGIWKRYVRYIGAGAVATGGLLTVLRNLPTMAGAFGAVVRGLGSGAAAPAGLDRTDRDLPPSFTALGMVFVIGMTALVPGVFGGGMGWGPRLVCACGVGVFGTLFVAVAARIVGIVGVSSQPTSGITLVTLLGTASVFAAMGWNDAGAKAAVLTVGTVVAVAASKAGDISQDLKTGFLVGATPARQQLGQLIGAAFACWAVAGTVLLLGSTYTFGSTEIPAPQATLMKTIIEGVLAGNLPWDLVLTGAGVAFAATLCGVSALAFSIGVYLPLASMLPIFLGGCARALAERAGSKEPKPDVGVLAGEGLAGIVVAALVATGVAAKFAPPRIGGSPGELLALATVAALLAFLVAAGRRGRA
jgi:putative OPT family oligopeptide transporter